MGDDSEPAKNISGGLGSPIEVETERSRSRLEAVIDRLGVLYWQKRYGGQDAFTCLVRTILSQNTSDTASQAAFEALEERVGDRNLAVFLRDADPDAIAETIQVAGLYNQKAATLQAAAKAVLSDYGDTEHFDKFTSTAPNEEARTALLAIDGVGPKTADCVLLFAAGREGIFPVDTHVHRVTRRLGVAPPDADHETVRQLLADRENLRPEKCGFGHTSMIQFGREYCTARRPACLSGSDACPLYDLCDRRGIDVTEGTTTDPRNTVGE